MVALARQTDGGGKGGREEEDRRAPSLIINGLAGERSVGHAGGPPPRRRAGRRADAGGERIHESPDEAADVNALGRARVNRGLRGPGSSGEAWGGGRAAANLRIGASSAGDVSAEGRVSCGRAVEKQYKGKNSRSAGGGCMGGEGEKAKLRLSTTFARWQDCPPVTPHSCADALQRN